ncbi:transposase [Candidatus Sumerlaeota bacterium]|nr:transposase [Candidatus Sumerlaeota bacterium]
MPQSLAAVYLHLVFSTKNRTPLLRERPFREHAHEYLGGVSKTLGCPPIRVGGTEDHVHILSRLGRTITIANWVKEVKRISSIWVDEQDIGVPDFHWQAGYGAFSVGHRELDRIVGYVQGQEEHHRTVSFQDELRRLLREHDLEFDEEHLWD